jgi:Na+-driven multidrug efflux pump
MIYADPILFRLLLFFFFFFNLLLPYMHSCIVQIGYALGRNDKVKTDQLIHTGIAGSIVTGIIAGSIGTLLSLLPNVFQALTNPGLTHDQLLYNGCEFFEDESKSKTAHVILPYWMLKSWSMIFQQIGMVMSGFFFGSKATMVRYLYQIYLSRSITTNQSFHSLTFVSIPFASVEYKRTGNWLDNDNIIKS